MNKAEQPTITQAEDLGVCIGCNEFLRVGEVITTWDDEQGHYDCNNPYSLTRQPELDADKETPPPVLLLGNPARCLSLEVVESAWNTRTTSIAAQADRDAAPENSCDLGVGCDEAGVCYAKANGKPEMCPRTTSLAAQDGLVEALEGLLEVHDALGAGQSFAARKARAALSAIKGDKS